MIRITPINSSFHQIEFDSEIEYVKTRNYFAIKMPGVEHTPAYKAGLTDGKKHFLPASGKILYGLKNKFIQYFETNGYEYSDETDEMNVNINEDELKKFIEMLDLPFELHDFQYNGILHLLQNPRSIILAATSAGKSVIIYVVLRYLTWKGLQSFVIVPEVGLVEQLYGDFQDYFYTKEKQLKETLSGLELDVEINSIKKNREHLGITEIESILHKIYGGQDKYVDVPIRISTFQSVYKEGRSEAVDPDFFKKVDCIFFDEVHRAVCSSVTEICNATVNAHYKLGCSGTLKSNLIDQLVLEGTIGDAERIVSARELMDRGLSTETIVYPIQLLYSKDTIKDVKKMKWQEESKFIRNHEERIYFISKFLKVLSQSGNTIGMFVNRDLGKALYEEISKVNEHTLYIDGEVSAKRRQEIKKITEENDNVIIIGSFKTIGTGVNIKNLQNMVFCQAYKEAVITMQALGRMMRKHKDKKVAKVYDIVDDLTYTTRTGREYPNYFMKHFYERLNAYNQYEFTVESPQKVKLEEDIF